MSVAFTHTEALRLGADLFPGRSSQPAKPRKLVGKEARKKGGRIVTK